MKMLSGNTLLMKEVNKELVRNSLRKLKKSTKQELSRETGLSVVTINSILQQMIEEKEVIEGEMIPSNGGRPSKTYDYNSSHQYIAVIYGRAINNKELFKLCIVDLSGECIYEEQKYLENIKYDAFDEMLDRVFKQYENISAVGFGLPGQEVEGIITINDFPNIIGNQFMKHYEERYFVPVIFVNDVNAAAIGYHHYITPHKSSDTFVAVYFPKKYGPGAGIIIDGKLYKGRDKFAGEIGLMPLDIQWETLDYSNEELVYEAIAKLVTVFCCIIAPSQFVLYGDFWSHGGAEKIVQCAEELVKGQFCVEIVLIDNFEKDFKTGMIKTTLELLENKIVIMKEN